MSMIEKVAVKLFDKLNPATNYGLAYQRPGISDDDRRAAKEFGMIPFPIEACRSLARAAIEAMEPTERMIEAGMDANDAYRDARGLAHVSLGPEGVWQAMITAALEGEG